jgi:hypothetical protein
MKLKEILPDMTKMYLQRTFNSVLRNVRVDSEDEMREVILRNTQEFRNNERVTKALNFLEADRDIEVLNELILLCLVESAEYMMTSSDLRQAIEDREQQIILDSQDDRYIASAIPEAARKIYMSVLTAAWNKDDSLNAHEKNILEVLRKELRLTRRHHRLLESRVGRFPQKKHKLHSNQQIDDALKDLQLRGILLRFKSGAEYFVIPEEIATAVRYEKGGELKAEGYAELLSSLRTDQLRAVCSEYELSTAGTKASLISRIQRFDILPSQTLSVLNSSDLTEILRKIKSLSISGSKESKIRRLIDHFEAKARIENSDPTDNRSLYFDALELLANRKYDELRELGIISKDIDVEHYFEEGTRYLFEKKLGVPIERFQGSAHADGRAKISRKEVLLWDNKSTESPYTFPEEHLNQFLNYIRADQMRPTVFLVIVGEYTPAVVQQAQKLKAFSAEVDTDVAIITARDLKAVAEDWRAYSTKKTPKFNLEVFNLTGVLKSEILKDRMKWAL